MKGYHQSQKRLTLEKEEDLIISTATRLLTADVKVKGGDKSTYPLYQTISSSDENLVYLLQSLRLFLETFIAPIDDATKVAALCQALIQTARPKALLTPLQIALGVQMHHLTSFRLIVDALNALGFSARMLKYANV